MAGYDNEERMISEFNEAKFQIFRLHNVWLECKSLREKGFLNKWRWKLDTAMIELWNDAKRIDGEEDESEKPEEKEKRYISKLKKVNKEINDSTKQKKIELIYNNLIKKELLLREIQEAAGKGGRLKSADEDYM